MPDTPTVVTDEMKQRLPGVWRGLYVALVENAATIDKLRADVERLRGACKYVSARIHSAPSSLPPGTDMGLIQTELYNALAETESKETKP